MRISHSRALFLSNKLSLKEVLKHFFVTLVGLGQFYFLKSAFNPDTSGFIYFFISSNNLLVEICLTFTTMVVINALLRNTVAYKLSNIAVDAGIFFYSKNTSNKDKRNIYNFISKELSGSPNILIAGATGWKTFGDINSPFHSALANSEKSQIILIYPFSDKIPLRVSDINRNNPDNPITVHEYTQEVLKSIKFLREQYHHADTSNNIELKLYHSYPFWKYIRLNNFLLIQQYPKLEHVDKSPYIAVGRTNDKKDLFQSFNRQLNRFWESHRLSRFDFKTDEIVFTDDNGIETKREKINFN